MQAGVLLFILKGLTDGLFKCPWPCNKFALYIRTVFSTTLSSMLNKCTLCYHRLVLGLVELIDAKKIYVTQPIWSSGCIKLVKKQAINAFFVFLEYFCNNVTQAHYHIG